MLPDTWISTPAAWLAIATVVLGLLGLAALAGLVHALRRGRPLRAVVRLVTALALVFGALSAALLALSLHGYARLTAETAVARLSFSAVGPNDWRARLVTADGRQLELALAGDEWQLDARVVKWMPWAVLAGLDPVYRLDRLSGRYRGIDAERSQVRTAHDLSGDRELDLWRLAERHPRWLPFVDTEYGSAAYLPIRPDVAYEVSLSPLGGLVARSVALSEQDARDD